MSSSKKFGRLSKPICRQIERLNGGIYDYKNPRRRKEQKIAAAVKREAQKNKASFRRRNSSV